MVKILLRDTSFRRLSVGYYPYQELNGGQRVTSKTAVRKRMRREGRGKGGCQPSSQQWSNTQVGHFVSSVQSTTVPKGRKHEFDSYRAYCHKGHSGDFFPEQVKNGGIYLCRQCDETFTVN